MIAHNLRYSLSALVFSLALLPTSLPAALVQTGSVTPDINTWNSTVSVNVGGSDAGSVTINGGSVVDTNYASVRTTGAATVTGAGSTWTSHYQLYVSGALTIEAGGKVSTPRTQLGLGSGGVATVTGTGSEWTTTIGMFIDGNGTLTIDAGGQVISPGVFLGYGAKGTATVTGVGSTWTNNGLLHVGTRGDGTLTIEAGGQVTSQGGTLGYGMSFVTPDPNWVGRVKVRGAGSKWNSGRLDVGVSGTGTLTIEAGGQVSSTSSTVGENGGFLNTALVTGAGSKWTNSFSLYVGRIGTGVLSITEAGLVTAGGLTIDWNRNRKSFINMATGGMLALSGDADDSLSQFLGLVGGTDAIRFWDASLSDWSPLTSATYGDDYTLSYLTEGDLSGYTLLTVGRAGDFDNDGDVDGGDFLTWQRGGSPTPKSPANLASWQAAYATPATANTGAVPEPTTWLLAASCCLYGLVRRRRR